MELAITFAPALPWTAIAVLAALAVLGIAAALYWRLPGWWLRFAAVAVLLLALTGPQLSRQEREGLGNVAFLVVDRSESTGLEERAARIDAAANEVADAVAALSIPRQPFELVTVDVASGTGTKDKGTRLLTALAEAAARVSPDRIAGAVLLTDGQIHDAARLRNFPGPVHALIAGERDAFDLRLRLDRAPAFGIVGETVTFRITADALGNVPAGIGPEVPVSVSVDGGPPRWLRVRLGVPTDLEIAVEHGGPTVVDIRLETIPGELTARNNRVIPTVNGVRDRLRVLLVSGEPYPGGRTWRDLLKADPAVELIHFTILRPPSKQDGTPVSELSLIAFPTRELFLEKIDGFDLIIFDRYRYRGLLSPAYFASVANYVRRGGAILFSVGPAFAGPQSLARTPLAGIMPATPSLDVIEQPYRPRLTEIGKRHPVTAGLVPGATGDAPGWGRWLRQIAVTPRSGNVVMSGHKGLPLLILDKVDEGRVALLASDQSWLWSRGFDGGGPQAGLLRRTAHWLMKEPDLEAEALRAHVEGTRVMIERRTLAEKAPEAVRAFPPGGGDPRVLAYEQVGPGRWQALMPDAAEGLWRFDDGEEQAVAAVGPPAPVEFANPLASPAPLAPLIEATGGAAGWLVDGVPDIRAVGEGRRTAGPGWIGLTARDAYRVTGIRQAPLLPAWLAALLAGLLLLGAWLRESR